MWVKLNNYGLFKIIVKCKQSKNNNKRENDKWNQRAVRSLYCPEYNDSRPCKTDHNNSSHSFCIPLYNVTLLLFLWRDGTYFSVSWIWAWPYDLLWPVVIRKCDTAETWKVLSHWDLFLSCYSLNPVPLGKPNSHPDTGQKPANQQTWVRRCGPRQTTKRPKKLIQPKANCQSIESQATELLTLSD